MKQQNIQQDEVSGESDNGRVKKKAWRPRKKLKLTKESSEDDNDVDYNDDSSNDGSEGVPKQSVCNKFIDDFAFASVDSQSKSDQHEDPDKMFLLSLLPHLKSIPEDMRLNVKLDLMQVLRNANYHTAVDHKII